MGSPKKSAEIRDLAFAKSATDLVALDYEADSLVLRIEQDAFHFLRMPALGEHVAGEALEDDLVADPRAELQLDLAELLLDSAGLETMKLGHAIILAEVIGPWGRPVPL